jgi:glycosyltransferase involved in cell wall biosynthesis
MRISLVTVARNASATIADTIQSVGRQKGVDFEHLLIDGASIDDTVSIARSNALHSLRVISERDGGIYDAMNKGIRLATGEIIGLINADDVLAHAGVLAQINSVFVNNPDLMGCYADLVYVDRDTPDRIVRHWQSGPFAPGLFARGWVPPHPTLYLRREVYERVGDFDLTYRLAADFELMLRIFEVQRLPMLHVSGVWVRMRLGGATSQGWRNVLAGNREIAAALRRHRIGWVPFTQTCRMLRRVPQFFSRPQ